jgi:hypothetical protein
MNYVQTLAIMSAIIRGSRAAWEPEYDEKRESVKCVELASLLLIEAQRMAGGLDKEAKDESFMREVLNLPK